MSETLIQRLERHAKDSPNKLVEVYASDVMEYINSLRADKSRLQAIELAATRVYNAGWTSERHEAMLDLEKALGAKTP